MGKNYLEINVLEAAQDRIRFTFDNFDKICVSFSGGKDSTVMLHMVMDEAIKRDRKVAVLIIDLEGQYKYTIDHMLDMVDMYRPHIDLYWVCLPISLRNAVSVFEPKWICWDAKHVDKWIRQPPKLAITDMSFFSFFRYGMEFEEFVPEFSRWYSRNQQKTDGVGDLTASLVGIRADESLNRYRTIVSERKSRYDGKRYTTWNGGSCYSVYPIYDWRTEDIWVYHGYTKYPYNKLYDRMYQAGLSIHQSRICQPYGDDQRKGLWLFHIIEPETWAKIVARVSGANSGALYATDSGNINGVNKISKPQNHTWETFSMALLGSMPPLMAEHYKNKIAIFIHWWKQKGVSKMPDEADPELEAKKAAPSWRRIAKTILRNDYWCKTLSFAPQKTTAFKKYELLIKNKRAAWKILN